VTLPACDLLPIDAAAIEDVTGWAILALSRIGRGKKFVALSAGGLKPTASPYGRMIGYRVMQ
jgi:hypothetical protein